MELLVFGLGLREEVVGVGEEGLGDGSLAKLEVGEVVLVVLVRDAIESLRRDVMSQHAILRIFSHGKHLFFSFFEYSLDKLILLILLVIFFIIIVLTMSIGSTDFALALIRLPSL